MATFTEVKVKLKLLIDKKSNKVVYAEAGKECVDFLFSILALPLGTITNLLSKDDDMVGCVGNLYRSVQDLDQMFVQPGESKDKILSPNVQHFCREQSNLLSISGLSGMPATRKFYKCAKCNVAVTDTANTMCPNCYGCNYMSSTILFAGSDSARYINSEGGFVQGLVTYMVMDDLQVKPLSTDSIIALLDKLNIRQVGSLEEKVVEIGKDEGLKLLKASLQTKKVLTTVLLEEE